MINAAYRGTGCPWRRTVTISVGTVVFFLMSACDGPLRIPAIQGPTLEIVNAVAVRDPNNASRVLVTLFGQVTPAVCPRITQETVSTRPPDTVSWVTLSVQTAANCEVGKVPGEFEHHFAADSAPWPSIVVVASRMQGEVFTRRVQVQSSPP